MGWIKNWPMGATLSIGLVISVSLSALVFLLLTRKSPAKARSRGQIRGRPGAEP